ncbi:myosin-binding protein 1-like isoform X2 [Carya illinoinensis]|nr:myosin-binding protein 1-like isoform X2 [Carya illinoinensis]
MAAIGNSFVKVRKSSSGFTDVLISTACEWFLIFLLLVDAILLYFLTKFASYCNLQPPCILCSRIDHLLGNEKPKFYQHMLCSNHRSEISSLISCHIHGKLVSGSGMCEDCLLSFTMKNNSSQETHRLLVSILGMDLVGYGFQSTLQNDDFISSSKSTKLCSCCNKPWRSRQKAQRLQQLKLPMSGLSSNYIHLSSHSQLNRRHRLKKIRDKFFGLETSHLLGKSGFDSLLHVGYSKLKITFDSEYEVPFIDDDGGGHVIPKKSEPKGDSKVQCTSKTPTKTIPKGLDLKQPTHHYNPMSLLVDPSVQPDVSQPQDMEFLVSNVATDHGLSELNWLQVNQKFDPYALPELTSLDDIPQVANVMEVSSGESTKGSLMLSHFQRSNSIAPVELITLDDNHPSVEASAEKYATGTSDLGHVSINENEEVLNSVCTAYGTSTHADQVIKDPAIMKSIHLDPRDVCKSVINDKEIEIYDIVTGQPIGREIDRVNEELKLLPSHDFFAEQIILSSSSTSPVVHGCDEQTIDTLNSNGNLTLQKSVFVESGLESWDASLSQIEGENLLDKLKQQVDKDRKCIRDLYKELEEERNASEIATNQAMAMITRLQEEKAALHMEALQYLRMMEEQAEYDVEALEKANDLLAEKEKEIQDLEAEVEFCRSNFPTELLAEIIHERNDGLKEECVVLKSTIVPSIIDNENVHYKSMRTEVPKSSDKPFVAKSPCLEFEEEKLYISQRLKNLERKLHQFSCDSTLSNMLNGGHFEKSMTGINDREKYITCKMSHQSDCQMEVKGSCMENDLHISNGSLTSHEGLAGSNCDNHYISEGNNFVNSSGEKHLMHQREIDFVVLGNEILDLNERLQALEEDNDFLEQSLNSLQNGSEGLQFVQEIAHQLQELRKIGIRLRCQSIT